MIRPVATDRSSEWHLERFTEFAVGKTLLGEPMAHGRTVLHLSREVDQSELAWRLGLYLNAWSVVGSEVIWENWPLRKYEADPAGFKAWLADHFAGIHTRKERRCVRTPENFADAVESYHTWMTTELPRLVGDHAGPSHEDYDAWWRSLNTVRYFGRYICANGLDAFRIAGFMRAELYELQTIGNHQSPMRGLSLLRQEDAPDLLGGEGIRFLNAIGAEVRQEVLRRGALPGGWLSWFAFAALLCEYRQYYEWGAEYAGNSHDEELSYLSSRYGEYWKKRGFSSQIFAGRREIFPQECLGEIQGWRGIREDVAWMLRNDGVVWSDLKYDYRATASSGRLVRRLPRSATEHYPPAVGPHPTL